MPPYNSVSPKGRKPTVGRKNSAHTECGTAHRTSVLDMLRAKVAKKRLAVFPTPTPQNTFHEPSGEYMLHPGYDKAKTNAWIETGEKPMFAVIRDGYACPLVMNPDGHRVPLDFKWHLANDLD